MKKRRKKDSRSKEEKAYYAWLATQPCVVSGMNCEERHHVRRRRFGAGGALKPPDWFAIPLGERTHKEQHNKGREWFEAHYGLEESFILPLWKKYGIDKIPPEIQARL